MPTLCFKHTRKEKKHYAGSRTPQHQLRKGGHIGPEYRMSNPHQRQGNRKYVWKTPPKLAHSKSRGTADALLKKPVALKNLVWSRGRLATLHILASSTAQQLVETICLTQCHFISSLWTVLWLANVFLMAGVHQQPDQSNYLAEGQT